MAIKKSEIVLTEKQQLIRGWLKRISYHQIQLAKTKKIHREIELKMFGKIKLELIQLHALQKGH